MARFSISPLRWAVRAAVVMFVLQIECYTRWQQMLFIVLGCLVLFPMSLFAIARLSQPKSHFLVVTQTVICSPYTAKHSYWQSVLVGQLLCMSLLFTFVTEPVSRSLSLTAICLLAFCVHVYARPFKLASMNDFQALMLGCLVLIACFNIPDGVLNSAATAMDALGKTFALASNYIQTVLLVTPFIVFIALRVTPKCRARFECCRRASSNACLRVLCCCCCRDSEPIFDVSDRGGARTGPLDDLDPSDENGRGLRSPQSHSHQSYGGVDREDVGVGLLDDVRSVNSESSVRLF